MAVKVVKRPEPNHAMCRNCGCELEYELKDLNKQMVYDYTGPDGYRYFITCPECNNEIRVSKND